MLSTFNETSSHHCRLSCEWQEPEPRDLEFAYKGHSRPGEWTLRNIRSQGLNWKTQQFPNLGCEGINIQSFLYPGSLPGSTQLKLLFCSYITIKLLYGLAV